MTPKENKFWRKVKIGNDCWEWTGGLKESGNGRFYEGMVDGVRKYATSHRVAYELTNGIIPSANTKVKHTCGSLKCVRPSHLILDVRLTENDVLNIRQELKSPYHSCTQLAEIYSVSPNTIYDIKKGRTWKNITV